MVHGFLVQMLYQQGSNLFLPVLNLNKMLTSLGIFIEKLWYDKEELNMDDSYLGDSTPKGENSSIGWLNMKYWDSAEKYTDQYIDENEFWELVNE